MQFTELNEFFVLLLVSIKQAYEGPEFSAADGKRLEVMFNQGIIYQAMLENEVLCDKNFVNCIGHFCELIQKALPPPEHCDFHAVDLVLVKTNLPKSLLQDVLVEAEINAANIFKAIIVNLMIVFQCSIVDLTAKLKTEKALSEVDVDNTNYVVGMAQTSTINLNLLIDEVDIFHESICEKTCKFMFDMVGFASSLKLSGLGLAV